MTTATGTAQMANNGDRWHLYVVLLNVPASQWPEYDFHRAAPVPTFTERTAALHDLGYVVADGVEWEWIETGDIVDDPSSAVRLIASLPVCSAWEAS